MKKSEFVKIFDPSNLDGIVVSGIEHDRSDFEKKKSIYGRYSALLCSALTFVPDDFVFGYLSSLNGLNTRKDLIGYIRESSPEDLEKKLNDSICSKG